MYTESWRRSTIDTSHGELLGFINSLHCIYVHTCKSQFIFLALSVMVCVSSNFIYDVRLIKLNVCTCGLI